MRGYVLAFVILLLFFVSCTRDKTSSNCPPCTSAISFKTNVLPIFQISCAVQGCHDVTTHAAAVVLDSANAYTNITQAGTGYIIAYNANASLFYTTLNSPGVNGMPKGLPPLPQCQVETIACWINQGAKNN